MKKTIAFFAALTMLLGMFMLPLSAQDAAPSLDDSLVVYYDFEGDTLEEQLSDKATAGASRENLTLGVTKNEAGEDLSYVKDGVAHIASTGNNYLLCEFDSETGVGKDIYENQTEMTVFVTFEVTGSWTVFVDFLDLNNIVRCFGKGITDGVSSNLEIRPAQNAYSKGTNAMPIKNGQVFVGLDTVTFAVTTQYDAVAKTVTVSPYVSFNDEQKFIATTPKVISDVETYYSDSAWLCLGKVFGYKHLDRGATFDYEEVRIYNKALTENELVSLLPEDSGSDNSGSTSDTSDSSSNTTTAPKPAETTAPVTDSVTTGADNVTSDEKKGGCGASMMLGTSMMMVLAVGATLVRKKKKD